MRSYSTIEEKAAQCNLGDKPVSIRVERGEHMGQPVAFVSRCEYTTLRRAVRYCSLSDRPCIYSVESGRAAEFFK